MKKILAALAALVLLAGCSQAPPRITVNNKFKVIGYDNGGFTPVILSELFSRNGAAFEQNAPTVTMETIFFGKDGKELEATSPETASFATVTLRMDTDPPFAISLEQPCADEKNSAATQKYYCVYGERVVERVVKAFLDYAPKQTPHKQ